MELGGFVPSRPSVEHAHGLLRDKTQDTAAMFLAGQKNASQGIGLRISASGAIPLRGTRCGMKISIGFGLRASGFGIASLRVPAEAFRCFA